VLLALLEEKVSIRNMPDILETLYHYSSSDANTAFLTAKVRAKLGRQICLRYAEIDDPCKYILYVVSLEYILEKTIIESAIDTYDGSMASLEPELHSKWIKALSSTLERARESGHAPVILCSEQARPLVRQTIKRELPDTAVLSITEIKDNIGLTPLGEVKVKEKQEGK
jgi:flagellar biosynthesis protein FlhA